MKTTKDEAGASRFSVSLEPGLLSAFDRFMAGSGYDCRSKAVRDLIRNRLAQDDVEAGKTPAIGVLTFVYDHEKYELAHRLVHLQHDHAAEIVTSVHVHLDARNCLEVLIMRGRGDRLKATADSLLALKGVRQGLLTLTPATCHVRHTRNHHREDHRR